MVRPERLELPAYWFEASRSIQLSYGRTPVIITSGLRVMRWQSASECLSRFREFIHF